MTARTIILFCVAVAAWGRDPIAVDFAIDSPGWGGEVITLPPGFAPDMRIKGVEDIRFAPGMFKPGAADFFSYIFVIASTAGQRMESAFIRQELLVYFQGLAKSVSKGSIDPSNFVFDLQRLKAKGPHAVYRGTLDWVEPFATRKPQKLHLDLHVQTHAGKDYLIVCVSPQSPEHAVWSTLRTVRRSFRLVAP